MKNYLIKKTYNLYLCFFLIICSRGFSEESVEELVGQAIWASLPDRSSEFISAFIQGMRNSNSSTEELLKYFNEDVEAEENLLLKEHLIEAEKLFESLKLKKDLHEVIPGKIYFRVKKKGQGKEIVNTECDILANYRIETIGGIELCNTISSEMIALPLSGLMPGLARGMIGMKEGEKREIFIHPEYSYNELPSIAGHPALIAKVKLETILPSSNQNFSLEPIQFSIAKIPKEELVKEYKNAHLKFAYQYGKAVWQHYKWGESDYSLEDIIKIIEKARQGNLIDLSTPIMQKKLVDLHWFLYQKQEKKL